MSAILPWWWRWAVLAIYTASIAGYFWFWGNEHGTQKLFDYQADQATQASHVIVKQADATRLVVEKYIQVAGKTRVVTETVEKEVIRYVEGKPLALACFLDDEWIRLHDRAAAGAVSSPGPRTDEGNGAPRVAP